MTIERPDLSGMPAEVIAYIEALEAELFDRQQPDSSHISGRAEEEPPTGQQVVSITEQGLAKRTPRHYYGRQRRGGMGVFDIEFPDDDRPAFLVVADEEANLLLLTDQGRAFRLPVTSVGQAAVRGRGKSILDMLSFGGDEQLAAVLPDEGGASLVIASERGWVRRQRAGFLGRTMLQGTVVHDVANGGALAAASWCSSDDELLMVTEQGQGLRFPGHHVRDRRGCLGIRLSEGDSVCAVLPVSEAGGVFLLTGDGKGTIRLMAGFRANKAPGAGGKQLIKADNVVGAVALSGADDLFVISRLGKIIRFAADEVPGKTGVVQGVNCISLRADEAVALAVAQPATMLLHTDPTRPDA